MWRRRRKEAGRRKKEDRRRRKRTAKTITSTEFLPCAGHCPSAFDAVLAIESSYNPMRQTSSSAPFYQ